MTKEQIFEKLKAIIHECIPNMDCSNLQLDTKIDSIGDLNSLSLMMILFDTEEKFGISIENPNKIFTIDDICSCVVNKLA